MYAKAEKKKENNHRSVSHSLVQKKRRETQGFFLTDNRPSAITQQQPDSKVIQLSKKNKNKQKRKQQERTFKRRQNLKKELLDAEDPFLLRMKYAQEFAGDELAMANLNNAWKDFQKNHNSKSDKEHRANLMLSLMKKFSLNQDASDEIEVTEQSDEESEIAVFVKESMAYGRHNFTRQNDPLKRLGDYKTQGEILARLVEKHPQYQQLAINLALHNYRTSLGGNRPQFRFTGHKTEYNRPFYDPLPGKMMRLLRKIKSAGKTEHATQQATDIAEKFSPQREYTLPQKYVPPTKFALTLPVDEVELQSRIGQSQHQELKTFIDSFSHIGSFGFSERSKTSWSAENGEAAGTRLSLGDGISESMYGHLENLLHLISNEMKIYEDFGSPGLKVLKASAVKDNDLKERREAHLNELEQLIVTLKKEVNQGHEKILGILNKHRKFFNKEEEGEYANFIIRESDLWEELIHVSTLLSELKINETLHDRHYNGLNDSKTTEYVTVDGKVMKRHLFSSGTRAADELYEHLGGSATNIKQGTGKLNTYTPYFEFYLSDDALLTKGKEPEAANMQAWINLSENAHDLFFDDVKPLDMNTGISKLSESIRNYIKILGSGNLSLKLVIDYTKFSSDLPKNEIYPLLSALKNKLISSDFISSVYYLKSGLKYNTGTIERYQSGEVLSYDEEKTSTDLEDRAVKSFMENPEIAGGSALNGHYIDLMRKVDALADYLLTKRRKHLVG